MGAWRHVNPITGISSGVDFPTKEEAERVADSFVESGQTPRYNVVYQEQTIPRRTDRMRSSFHRFHLAAGDHFDTTTDAYTYVEARERGKSPSEALKMVRVEANIRDVLKFSADFDGAPYQYPDDAYDVDVEALARVTAGPMLNVVNPNGSHPDGTVRVPEGAKVRAFVYRDQGHGIDEDECYGDADIAAWKADEWKFVGVSAVVTLADGSEGESAVWGVEQGDYWPGSDEYDIWHVVPDMIYEALRTAEREASRAAQIAFDQERRPGLDYILLLASDDPVKRDLEVTCDRCSEHLCDAEHGDSMRVLLDVAQGHQCPIDFFKP